MRRTFNRVLAISSYALVASASICNLHLSDDIAKLLPHGDSNQNYEISRCVAKLPTLDIPSIEQCLMAAQMTAAEAHRISPYILDICDTDTIPRIVEEDLVDLRKRDDSTTVDSKTGKATNTASKTNAAKTTAAASTSAASTSANSDSTSAAASSSAAPSTPSSTAAPTTTSQSSSTSDTTSATSSSPTTSASANSATAPLTCLTTNFLTTTWCVTTTQGASTGTSCFPTTTPSVKCSDGLLCFENGGAPTTCMRREDNLTTSGLVVTIAFGVAVAAMLSAFFWMCCRSRVADRRARRAREALLIATSNKARQDSKTDLESRGASEAYLPLMASQGSAGFTGHRRDLSADYAMEGDAGRPPMHRVPSGSYQDVVASRTPNVPPKLHPGLGAVQFQDTPSMYDGDDYDDIGISRQR